jgi:hypothetical protein
VPRLASEAFDPLDQLRHSFIARLFEDAAEKAPAQPA